VTPPAATVAGRRRSSARPARSSRVGGARPPRRVSGPARPARTARPAAALGGRLVAAAAAALPQPLTQPSPPPRRRPQAVPRPARRPDLPLAQRLAGWVRTLPDHRLLDRLIGGRIWIVLLGTLLVGIVTLQLSLLRLNAGIGRAVEHSSALEQRNAALRLEISRLSDSERIVSLATQMGFVTPPQGSPRFLTTNAGDAAKALTTMRVPDPAAASAATAVTGSLDPSASVDPTTVDPAATEPPTAPTTTDPATTTTTTGATVPATGTTTPTTGTTTPSTGTTVPAAGTTTPATGATTPTASAPAPVAAGGATAPPTGPVGGQG
jgi:hypothetical protein